MCRLGTMHVQCHRHTDSRTTLVTSVGDQYDRLIKIIQTNKKTIFLELGYLKISQNVSVKCHSIRLRSLINVLRVCSA